MQVEKALKKPLKLELAHWILLLPPIEKISDPLFVIPDPTIIPELPDIVSPTLISTEEDIYDVPSYQSLSPPPPELSIQFKLVPVEDNI